MSDVNDRVASRAALNWGQECLSSGQCAQPMHELADRINMVAERLQPLNQELAAKLRKPVEQMTRKTVTVTFGGRFKAGKSMLVNKLLEREILPVEIEPETGAPCFVHSAQQDKAVAMRGMKLIEFPATTEALREQLSLWRRNIGELTADLADRVNLELTGIAVPENARWVDTPGVDDSPQMDAVSIEVFQRTDVLIWVLNSEAALSLEEQRYISDYVENSGPRGIIFLTNVFIRDTRTYDESWQAFVNRQLPAVSNRITQAAESMGFGHHAPRMLAVCGTAFDGARNGEYGAGPVKELLQSIRSREHNMVAACRLHRVSLAVSRTAASIQSDHAREVDENNRAEAEWQLHEQETKMRLDAFEREVNVALKTLVTQLRNETVAAAQSVASEVYGFNIQRDYTYSVRLDNKIKEGLQKVTAEYEKTVQTAARQYSVTCMSQDFLAEVRSQIPVPNCFAKVPTTPVKFVTAVGAGVLTATVVASIFTFGLAAPAAAATAAVLAKQEKDKALATDVAEAKANIHAEADKYHKQSSTWESKVLKATQNAFAIVEPMRERPNRAREYALEELAEELWRLGQQVQDLAVAN